MHRRKKKNLLSNTIPVDCAAFYPPQPAWDQDRCRRRLFFALSTFPLSLCINLLHFASICYTSHFTFIYKHTLVLSAWCCKCNLSSMHCDKRIKHLQEKILSSLETVCCPFWIVACHHQCNAGYLGKHWLSVLQPMSPISSFFESFELKRNVGCTERKQTFKHH